jgi:hypothetical protein
MMLVHEIQNISEGRNLNANLSGVIGTIATLICYVPLYAVTSNYTWTFIA